MFLFLLIPNYALQKPNFNNLAQQVTQEQNILTPEQNMQAQDQNMLGLNNMFNKTVQNIPVQQNMLTPEQNMQAQEQPMLSNMFNKTVQNTPVQENMPAQQNMPAQEINVSQQNMPTQGQNMLSNMFNKTVQNTPVQNEPQKSWWERWIPKIQQVTPPQDNVSARLEEERNKIYGIEPSPQEMASYHMGREAMMRTNSPFWGESPEIQAQREHIMRSVPGPLQRRVMQERGLIR